MSEGKKCWLSIIIPTYNRCDLLKKAIESIAFNVSEGIEIIVVDDNSTESFSKLMLEFGDRVRWVRSSGLGAGGARNFGARFAQGNYLAFLDSDDLYYAEFVKEIGSVVEYGKKKGLVVMVTSDTFDESEPELRRDVILKEVVEFRNFIEIEIEIRRKGMRFGAIDKEIFEKVGGFAENISHCEDMDLGLRMGSGYRTSVIVKPSLQAYRVHSAQVSKMVEKFVAGHKWIQNNFEANRYPEIGTHYKKYNDWIAESARCIVLLLARDVRLKAAVGFYFSTLKYQRRAFRIKYIVGFWGYLLYCVARKVGRH